MHRKIDGHDLFAYWLKDYSIYFSVFLVYAKQSFFCVDNKVDNRKTTLCYLSPHASMVFTAIEFKLLVLKALYVVYR